MSIGNHDVWVSASEMARLLIIKSWDYSPKNRMFFANFGPYIGLVRSLHYHKELKEWCEENYCVLTSDWVECPDDETAVLFKLRWT